MNSRPIRSARDHRAALKDIESLMGRAAIRSMASAWMCW